MIQTNKPLWLEQPLTNTDQNYKMLKVYSPREAILSL